MDSIIISTRDRADKLQDFLGSLVDVSVSHARLLWAA